MHPASARPAPRPCGLSPALPERESHDPTPAAPAELQPRSRTPKQLRTSVDNPRQPVMPQALLLRPLESSLAFQPLLHPTFLGITFIPERQPNNHFLRVPSLPCNKFDLEVHVQPHPNGCHLPSALPYKPTTSRPPLNIATSIPAGALQWAWTSVFQRATRAIPEHASSPDNFWRGGQRGNCRTRVRLHLCDVRLGGRLSLTEDRL
jgi:hypothetical protein